MVEVVARSGPGACQFAPWSAENAKVAAARSARTRAVAALTTIILTLSVIMFVLPIRHAEPGQSIAPALASHIFNYPHNE